MIGDLINFSPCLKIIKDNIKNSHITLICSEYNFQVAKNYTYIDEFIISYGDESFSKIEHSNHYDLGYSYILKYRDKSDNFDFSNKLLKDAQESDVEQLIIQFINDAQNTFYKAIDRNLAINKYLIEIGIDKPMIINFKNYSVKQPYNELPVNAPITIVLLLLLALFNLVYFINANENK